MTSNLQEERKTSDTGGQKGQKVARFDLVPFTFLWELACVCGKGAAKYDDDNWRKGYSWRLSYGAMQRHLSLFWTGESYDDETQLHHLAHAAWHCFVLFVFSTVDRYKKFDDRPDVGGRVYGIKKPHCDPEGSLADHYASQEALTWTGEGVANTAVEETIVIDPDKTENFIRVEVLNGHTVSFIDEDHGDIDGKRHRGTDFTAKVDLYRKGFNNIDEAVEAQYAESKSDDGWK